MRFFTKRGRAPLAAAAAAALFSAVFLTGCGGDDDRSDCRGCRVDGRLVCGPGEAWVDSPYAMVMKENGDCVELHKSGGVWYVAVQRTWSANGEKLTLTNMRGGVSITVTYSVDVTAGTLTMNLIDEVEVWTKQTGIYY